MADMPDPEPSFARNSAAAAYYERGAAEYDDWYLGVGQHAEYDRPDYHVEVSRLVDAIAALAPARTLDVACGSGFLSRHASRCCRRRRPESLDGTVGQVPAPGEHGRAR